MTPRLMGIVNITPDSFSKDGLSGDTEKTIAQIKQFISDGANCIDIGAESTRPQAKLLTEKEEWERLEPVLKTIQSNNLTNIEYSVDTRKASIVENILSMGFPVHYINDVEGKETRDIINLIKNTDINYITMHHLGVPPQKNITLRETQDPVKQLIEWGKKQGEDLINMGLAPEQLILDCGLGFGKTAEQTRTILKNANLLKNIGFPILIGHSRKSYLTTITEKSPQNRDLETAILSAFLAKSEINWLRVHNIAFTKRAITLQNWIKG